MKEAIMSIPSNPSLLADLLERQWGERRKDNQALPDLDTYVQALIELNREENDDFSSIRPVDG